jgi:hypothetical protein
VADTTSIILHVIPAAWTNLAVNIFACYWPQKWTSLFQALWCMPVFIQQYELNQYTIENPILRWSLSTYILWLRVCCNMPSRIQHYLSININIYTNNAQELTLYRFEVNCDAKRIRHILSLLRFEPRSLGQRLYTFYTNTQFKRCLCSLCLPLATKPFIAPPPTWESRSLVKLFMPVATHA